MNVTQRQRELTNLLDKAARVYEQGQDEIMSNFEYDRLYDELKALEEKSGTVLANSPTARPGYEVLSELPKFKHETPCLSLDKTKSRAALSEWLNGHDGVLSWKMDGLTVVLTYENGELVRAVTRGNGEIGEVITNNAKVFKNVPVKIAFKGTLVIRGEAVIKYSDFEKINDAISDPAEKYKNPRNLCSGSVRQLNNEITAKRNVHLFAFTLFSASGDENFNTDFKTINDGFDFLERLGFTVVEHKTVNSTNVENAVQYFADKIESNDFPSDGLVLCFDNIAYGESLGRTSKFPRNAIAFKWADETALTHIREFEWSASRTGLINPVAIFDPVELEGTTVSRASLHNVSVTEELAIGIGDEVSVYKANMIIPQIAENFTKSGKLIIPSECPVCRGKTEIKDNGGNRFLYCMNPDCTAKKLGSFVQFVSRDAMNIEGISESTLEKFIALGYIHDYADIYRLSGHRDEIVTLDGFGEKSYNNLQTAIEKSKDIELPNFIFALGIPNIGLANARLICRELGGTLDAVLNADRDKLLAINQIGDVIADSVVNFMADEKNRAEIVALNEYVRIGEPEVVDEASLSLKGLTFVITGSVEHYANRNELKAFIEKKGGSVASAVSKSTNYLFNNDVMSNSSKNKKAKELGVEIISEEAFIERFGN